MYSANSIVFLCYFFVKVSPAIIQGKMSEEMCIEKECYEAADQIAKWMNPAFNPCDDFYEFTCGYWHTPDNLTLEQGANTSLGLKGDIVGYHLKRILLDPPGIQEAPLFELLREVLSLCMDEDTLKTQGVSPLLKFMKTLGGWPLLEEDWQEDKWDFVNVEIITGQILRVSNEYSYKLDREVVEIYVSIPDEYEDDDIENIYELLGAFGINTDKAEKEINETFEVVKDLNKILNKPYERKLYNISELQEDISWVDWTRLFTEILPDSVSVADIEPVSVEKPEVFKALGKYIEQHPKRTIANLEMTFLAGRLSQYLSPEVANITYPSTKLRYDHCVDLVKRSCLDRVIAAYIAKVTADDIRTASDITERLKEELLKDVEDLKWLDEKTRKEAVEKMSELGIIIGFPESFVDMNSLEDAYKELKISTSSFLEAMVDSENWKKREEFIGYSKEEEEEEEFGPLTVLLSNVNFYYGPLAFYSPIGNFIVVSSGFLHFLPLFSSKLPQYINYGHFGYVIAHELTHALDVEEIKDEEEESDEKIDYGGIFLRWGSNATKEVYEEKKQCIIEQYSSFNDTKYTKEQLNGTFTQDEDVADNGGMKLALRAYRRVTENLLAPEPRLPLLEKYLPEQLFMVSAANFYCEIPEYRKRKSLIKEDSHTLGDYRVRGIMMNSPDFSESFHCNKDDPMNPSNKCEVW